MDGVKTESISPDKAKEMFGIYYIYEYIKQNLKNKSKENNPAILFKYHMLWGVHKILGLKYKEEDIKNILKNIVEKGVYVNKNVNANKEKDFNKYFDKIMRSINYIIKQKRDKDNTFVIRNYQRSKTFVSELDLYIKEMVAPNDLPDLI